MKVEFKILSRVMAESLPPVYPYQVPGAEQAVKATDFDDRVDVLPVSDENIFLKASALLCSNRTTNGYASPEIHNIPEVYRRVYDAMGVKNVNQILKARS